MLAYCLQDSAQCPLLVKRGVGSDAISCHGSFNSWPVNRNLGGAAKNQIWNLGASRMEAGDRTVLTHTSKNRTRSSAPDWGAHPRMHRSSTSSARKGRLGSQG